MVTHASLMANLRSILRSSPRDCPVVVPTWLPHFHDMGLIGTLLFPLFAGGTVVAMPPIAFLKRPLRWLETADRWRATMIVAPNFAYDLCARAATDAQAATFDLSSLRWVMNGAEPVRAVTLDRFRRRFAAAGLRHSTFSPCYGMAEVTLMATITRPREEPTIYLASPSDLERREVRPIQSGRGVRLVSSGPVDGVDVRIVDPGRSVLADGQVGEIWLRGRQCRGRLLEPAGCDREHLRGADRGRRGPVPPHR